TAVVRRLHFARIRAREVRVGIGWATGVRNGDRADVRAVGQQLRPGIRDVEVHLIEERRLFHEGQNANLPGDAGEIRAATEARASRVGTACAADRKDLVHVVVVVKAEPELLQVVLTLRSAGRLAGCLDGGQQ